MSVVLHILTFLAVPVKRLAVEKHSVTVLASERRNITIFHFMHSFMLGHVFLTSRFVVAINPVAFNKRSGVCFMMPFE